MSAEAVSDSTKQYRAFARLCIVLRVHAEDGSLLTNLTLAGRAVEVAPEGEL